MLDDSWGVLINCGHLYPAENTVSPDFPRRSNNERADDIEEKRFISNEHESIN